MNGVAKLRGQFEQDAFPVSTRRLDFSELGLLKTLWPEYGNRWPNSRTGA